MKKIISLILTLVMVMGLAVSASAATITVTPPTVPEGAEEKGITYTAYKVFDAVIDGSNVAYTIDANNQFFYTIKDSNYFTLTQLNGTNTYIVVANATYTTEENAKTLAASLKDVAITADATFTNEKGSAEVDEGYYLITSTVGDALILDTTQTNAFATKNTYPSLEKTADKDTAGLGDTVTFTITVTIPEAASGEIIVHDTMTGLDFVAMTAPTSGVTVSETTGDNCSVHFTIDENSVAAGDTVTITYTAIVTADTAENEAYLQDGNYTSTPVEVTVKNYKFDVYKWTAGETANAKSGLAGAGFVLKNTEDKYYKYTAATETAPAKVEWVVDIKEATELFSSKNNEYTVTFEGLANGTYTLIENTVPAGYNAIQNVPVTINGANMIDENQIAVENKTGSELPSTGGMGTTLFYVIGGLMMAGAAVLLVTKKRMA